MGLQSIFIRDEVLGAVDQPERFALALPSAEVSVADIIRERVRYEVDAYNRDLAVKTFAGLVRPSERERRLNTAKTHRVIDADAQIKAALKGFASNAFIMLIDDVQVETLEQKVMVRPDMEVTFLKLTPLVGG